MDPATLRAEFPVFERFAYLNAGTCGPLPRGRRHGRRRGARARAPSRAAATRTSRRCSTAARACATPTPRCSAPPADDVALTTCTSEGIVRVLGALDLEPGDEVLTSDEEHPGLQGPLAAARDQRGVVVRAVPFARDRRARSARRRSSSPARTSAGSTAASSPDLTDSATCRCCSTARRASARSPIDVATLGCAFYAGSGQKWLCGPVGTGCCGSRREWSERLPAHRPDVHEPRGPGRRPRRRAARRAPPATTPPRRASETIAAALAALDVLGGAGWDARPRARRDARRAARRRARRARPRGRAARPHDARLLEGRRPGGDAHAARRGRRDHPRPARAPGCCARRSAPGTTSRTSIGCSSALP